VRSFHLVRPEADPHHHLHERVSLPRGWYDVPDRPGRQRFWDGHRFVAARPTPSDGAEAQPAAAAPSVPDRRRPPLVVAGLMCAVLAAVLALLVASGLVAIWWASGAAALGAASFAILGHSTQLADGRS
jgi:hypothetical protein